MPKKNIAIIPARKGSKRIPNKNARFFCGKPVIQFAIEAAINSEIFDQIIISTDSNEIASTAIDLGAHYSIKRPDYLSDDHTPTVSVIAHATALMMRDYSIQDLNVCCIYPVNPFIEATDLINGLNILNSDETTNYIIPVARYSYPIQRAIEINRNNKIKMLNPEHLMTRTQDLSDSYHDAGQWYWGKATAWVGREKLLDNASALVLPNWRVLDIDTEEDWRRAELLYRLLKSE